ncbi:SDR family NAD(P)-dependent oxidoreductase [Rhodovulum sp. FJ3]|uniref:SDR family NAD(P)-dependent oxidoreductase n=1 Tax=Rhodovulum sp. FJ3 TaxID=3079053 RepID=UPI00293DBB76|nr:SDR family NAD(P)-dependent oxidoreductase [Rhodovulum sp. FJ3]MDV4168586.1 SDR family NAD(P)-dependent oxidoreductase [Rhodovulum sp. FJ3]
MEAQKSLIIGASGGIGTALCDALTSRGETVVGLSRSGDGLDITDEESISRALSGVDGPFHRIIVATGGLEIDGNGPEKSFRELDADRLMAQFRLNAMGPALVLKHVMPLIPRDGRAVLSVLSARVGSIGDNRLGGWHAYRAAKAAVNQIVHGAAIELARTHKQAIAVALHPGTVQTELTRKYVGRHPAVPPHEAAQNLIRVMDGLDVTDTGGFFDWAGKVIPW